MRRNRTQFEGVLFYSLLWSFHMALDIEVNHSAGNGILLVTG